MSRPHTPAFNIRRTPINTSSLNLTSVTTSSSQATPSRSATPSITSRHVISLEEWESRAPLSNEQLQSISLVKDRFGERPVPEKVRSCLPRQSVQAGCSYEQAELNEVMDIVQQCGIIRASFISTNHTHCSSPTSTRQLAQLYISNPLPSTITSRFTHPNLPSDRS